MARTCLSTSIQATGVRSVTFIRTVCGHPRVTATFSMRAIEETRASIAVVSIRAKGTPSGTSAFSLTVVVFRLECPLTFTLPTASHDENHTIQPANTIRPRMAAPPRTTDQRRNRRRFCARANLSRDVRVIAPAQDRRYPAFLATGGRAWSYH